MIKEIKNFDKETWIEITNYNNTNFEIPETWTKIFYKKYPRFKQIKLTANIKNKDIEKTILKRKSTRKFSDTLITFNQISHILQFSAGEKPFNSDRRMYPSGGARYPIELYLFVYNVKGLKQGLYHYNVKDNTLELLKEKNPDYKIFYGDNIKNANAVILMTGVMIRSEVKYLINSYKYALIETGHIAENVLLLSENIEIGTCCLGGFDNKKIIKYLDLVEDEEIPLYAIALGLLPL